MTNRQVALQLAVQIASQGSGEIWASRRDAALAVAGAFLEFLEADEHTFPGDTFPPAAAQRVAA